MNRTAERLIKENIRDLKRNRNQYFLKDYHDGMARGTVYTLKRLDIITEEEKKTALKLIERARREKRCS